jgi:hypothetical protein
MANLVDFPVPLCSIAEQLYITGLNKDFGAQDDAGLVRLWTSEPVTSLPPLSDEDKKAKLELVSNLLNGIHLCAAAEGISFAKHLGVPLPQYYELCVEAAGGSTQYKEQGIKMIDILELPRRIEGGYSRGAREEDPVAFGQRGVESGRAGWQGAEPGVAPEAVHGVMGTDERTLECNTHYCECIKNVGFGRDCVF